MPPEVLKKVPDAVQFFFEHPVKYASVLLAVASSASFPPGLLGSVIVVKLVVPEDLTISIVTLVAT